MERVKEIEPSFSAWEADDVPIYSKVDIHDQKSNVRFGSQADLLPDITPTAASGGKADVAQPTDWRYFQLYS